MSIRHIINRFYLTWYSRYIIILLSLLCAGSGIFTLCLQPLSANQDLPTSQGHIPYMNYEPSSYNTNTIENGQKEFINTDSIASENHTETLLEDGRVLIIGGITEGKILNNAKIYLPQVNPDLTVQPQTWQNIAPMKIDRHQHTATLLSTGDILVVGGQNNRGGTTSVEIYRPGDNIWYSAANLNHARYDHTATLLMDGQVLVVGGVHSEQSAEIYDPENDQWTEVANLNIGRYGHRDVILPDGRVIVIGGHVSHNGVLEVLRSVEFYDPTTEVWTEIADMSEARISHTATLLPNGHLLVR